jgi:hypothetical protein
LVFLLTSFSSSFRRRSLLRPSKPRYASEVQP